MIKLPLNGYMLRGEIHVDLFQSILRCKIEMVFFNFCFRVSRVFFFSCLWFLKYHEIEFFLLIFMWDLKEVLTDFLNIYLSMSVYIYTYINVFKTVVCNYFSIKDFYFVSVLSPSLSCFGSFLSQRILKKWNNTSFLLKKINQMHQCKITDQGTGMSSCQNYWPEVSILKWRIRNTLK